MCSFKILNPAERKEKVKLAAMYGAVRSNFPQKNLY
jgi:hypothetical protein